MRQTDGQTNRQTERRAGALQDVIVRRNRLQLLEHSPTTTNSSLLIAAVNRLLLLLLLLKDAAVWMRMRNRGVQITRITVRQQIRGSALIQLQNINCRSHYRGAKKAIIQYKMSNLLLQKRTCLFSCCVAVAMEIYQYI